MTWPSVPDALFELVDGNVFAGQTATAYLRLKTDFADHMPAVLIYATGGSEGQIDRAENINLTVYAPGQQAVQVAGAIVQDLEGANVHTSEGLLDTIDVSVTPYDVPYVDAEIDQANAMLTVRVRPRP